MWVFWALLNYWSKGGGEKFGRVSKGGQKILGFEFFGILRENRDTALKVVCLNKVIRDRYKDLINNVGLASGCFYPIEESLNRSSLFFRESNLFQAKVL